MIFSQTTTKIDHKVTFYNGHWGTYFKLLFMGKNAFIKTLLASFKMFNFYQKIYLYISLPFKFIWWTIIKLFGWFFSKKVQYEGVYNTTSRSNKIEYNILKKSTFRFLYISIFSYWTKTLDQKDFERLMKSNLNGFNFIKNKNLKY